MSDVLSRFLACVDRESDCGCWVWKGAKASAGYGGFRFKGRRTGAHRAAYELFKGPIPAGKIVCHTCDNRICVNPEHLYAGTPQSNMDDKMRRGRHRSPKGEAHGRAKLSAEAVRDIRTRRLTQMAFADLYGVSKATVWQVQVGWIWGHLR